MDEHEPDYNRMIVAEARLDVAEARLAQIRDLCDYADRGLSEGPTGWVDTVDILAILDAAPVDVTPPQGIRDALIARLQSINWGNSATRIDRDRFWGECADAILALVRPVPPQTIDRDALLDWIKGRDWREWNYPTEVVDGILALVRPVEGDEHEPTWREKFFEVDALARERRKQLEAIRALPVQRLSPDADALGWVSAEAVQRILDAGERST